MATTEDSFTKSALIEAVKSELGLPSNAETTRVVEAVITQLADGIKKHGGASIFGFGNFKIGERAERTGRNPATGETIKIAASKTLGFKPAKNFKERCGA